MQPRCVQRQENAPIPSSFRITNRSRSCNHVSVFILKSDGRPMENRWGSPSSKSGTATRTPPTTADRAHAPATAWPARVRKSRRDVASSPAGRESAGSRLSVLGDAVSGPPQASVGFRARACSRVVNRFRLCLQDSGVVTGWHQYRSRKMVCQLRNARQMPPPLPWIPACAGMTARERESGVGLSSAAFQTTRLK